MRNRDVTDNLNCHAYAANAQLQSLSYSKTALASGIERYYSVIPANIDSCGLTVVPGK